MNLIDAIKSGKPFKRKEWRSIDWFDFDDVRHTFSKEDIVAGDWEIQKEPKKRWLAWGHHGTSGEIYMLELYIEGDKQVPASVRLPWLDPPADWQPEEK